MHDLDYGSLPMWKSEVSVQSNYLNLTNLRYCCYYHLYYAVDFKDLDFFFFFSLILFQYVCNMVMNLYLQFTVQMEIYDELEIVITSGLAVLKADLMAALNKEVKSLDEDNWKFEGPRSRIHLISRPG